MKIKRKYPYIPLNSPKYINFLILIYPPFPRITREFNKNLIQNKHQSIIASANKSNDAPPNLPSTPSPPSHARHKHLKYSVTIRSWFRVACIDKECRGDRNEFVHSSYGIYPRGLCTGQPLSKFRGRAR